MTREETKAVLAHEMSHVNNGDMVTLSLIQGVVNTFVIVLSQVISNIVDRNRRGGYNVQGYGFGRGVGYRATYMITQLVLGFLATLVVRWFSRWREYRADAGGAALAGQDNMIAALELMFLTVASAAAGNGGKRRNPWCDWIEKTYDDTSAT